MIEVLISTVECTDYKELIDKMNVTTDAVISNQASSNSTESYTVKGQRIKFLTIKGRGVGRNRNNTLFNSDKEICMLSDDDVIFEKNYEKKILQAFYDNPSADIIIFNLDDKENRRYKIKKAMNINKLNYTKFGAARIAFKRESILKKRVTFSTLFGGGAKYSAGEDTLFLKDCIYSGLKIVGVPITIGELDESSDSTWFKGYNEKLLKDTGACYSELFQRTFLLRILYFAIRREKEYKKNKITFNECLQLLLNGAKEFQNNEISKEIFEKNNSMP